MPLVDMFIHKYKSNILSLETVGFFRINPETSLEEFFRLNRKNIYFAQQTQDERQTQIEKRQIERQKQAELRMKENEKRKEELHKQTEQRLKEAEKRLEELHKQTEKRLKEAEERH